MIKQSEGEMDTLEYSWRMGEAIIRGLHQKFIQDFDDGYGLEDTGHTFDLKTAINAITKLLTDDGLEPRKVDELGWHLYDLAKDLYIKLWIEYFEPPDEDRAIEEERDWFSKLYMDEGGNNLLGRLLGISEQKTQGRRNVDIDKWDFSLRASKAIIKELSEGFEGGFEEGQGSIELEHVLSVKAILTSMSEFLGTEGIEPDAINGFEQTLYRFTKDLFVKIGAEHILKQVDETVDPQGVIDEGNYLFDYLYENEDYGDLI